MPEPSDSELMEAARQMEDEHAPDCSDCGAGMGLRGVQRNGNDTGWLVQWKCPECDPERVKIDKGLPDGYEVVPLEPGQSEQMTLSQVATDGGRRQAFGKRYPCPREGCNGVFREKPSTGHGTEWRCSECEEAWPK